MNQVVAPGCGGVPAPFWVHIGKSDTRITSIGSVETTVNDVCKQKSVNAFAVFSTFRPQTGFVMGVKKHEPGRCARMWRCSGTPPCPIWQVRHADHVYRVCRGNGYNRLQSLNSQFLTFRPQTGFVMHVKNDETGRCPRMWRCSGTPPCPIWQV